MFFNVIITIEFYGYLFLCFPFQEILYSNEFFQKNGLLPSAFYVDLSTMVSAKFSLAIPSPSDTFASINDANVRTL